MSTRQWSIDHKSPGFLWSRIEARHKSYRRKVHDECSQDMYMETTLMYNQHDAPPTQPRSIISHLNSLPVTISTKMKHCIPATALGCTVLRPLSRVFFVGGDLWIDGVHDKRLGDGKLECRVLHEC
jgi:hypothetical protein